MPTPFMHLHMAEQIKTYAIAHPTEVKPDVLALIKEHWSAFYFGNIVPDFQAISEVKRSASHFYGIPPEKGDYGAFGRMQAENGEFADSRQLSADKAVFIAAYGAHLLYDLIWDHGVLTPRFRNSAWAEPWQRFTAHNTLLTYLDKRALKHVPNGADQILDFDSLDDSLSFARPGDLANWRQQIAAQLKPEAPIRTIEVYAGRMKLTPEQFAANLDDPKWMQENIFEHAPLDFVQATLDSAVPRSARLINEYLERRFT